MEKSNIVLNKRWKEIVFAASGFGPNLLMVLMMAYFTDAIIPTGLSADVSFWSYGGVIIVQTILFPILWTIGRIFDGVVDVPLAAVADTFGNKNKKRAFVLFLSFFPMIISFTLCWIPVFGMNKDISLAAQVGNSIWIFVMSIIFFASYTLALIVFYGSLSSVCVNQTQRSRVSAYKSVFDTINYALVYALIPFVFKAINIPIWQVAIILSPLMITIFIPSLLFRKKDVQYNDEQILKEKEKRVSLGKSFALTISSRPFVKWLIVNCVSFFGLQMFLVSQNTLISGVMNLGAQWAALLNTAAFAPVPIMLYFYNKLRRKKGIRYAFQTCLICFAIGMLSFCFAGTYFWGDNIAPKLIIGVAGGIIGSWGIGAFFMTPYLIPSQIASVENEVTGKNHSAMYFAVQALTTSAIGAIASSLIYNYLKLWVSPSGSKIQWKYGVSLVPFIVAVVCIIGFFLCFLMPKKYTPQIVANDIKKSAKRKMLSLKKHEETLLKKQNYEIKKINKTKLSKEEKELLITNLENKYKLEIIKIRMKIEEKEKILNQVIIRENVDDEERFKYYEKEGLLETICLTILSGFIFGIYDLFNSIKKCKSLNIIFSKKQKVFFYLSLFVPFLNIYTNVTIQKCLEFKLKELNGEYKSKQILVGITSIFFPFFLNIIAIACRIIVLNKIYDLTN